MDEEQPDIQGAKYQIKDALRTNERWGDGEVITRARLVRAYKMLGGDPSDLP